MKKTEKRRLNQLKPGCALSVSAPSWGWDLAEWFVRLTANAEVATVLGSNLKSWDTVKPEGRQMKQCWIKNYKTTPQKKSSVPPEIQTHVRSKALYTKKLSSRLFYSMTIERPGWWQDIDPAPCDIIPNLTMTFTGGIRLTTFLARCLTFSSLVRFPWPGQGNLLTKGYL
jgi:hypothetical protein